MTSDSYTLYGMAGSLYTTKVRAYLRQRRLPFVEKPAGGEEFLKTVVPHVGRWIIPVVKTPEGELLQDGTDIIDALEERHNSDERLGPTLAPEGIVGVISSLFELFGSEGLLRPAMHYRWNFDDSNLAFLQAAFEDVMPAGMNAEEREATFLKSSGRMRKAAQLFGVAPHSIETIERSYETFLALLEHHLSATPFLLGAYPTLADYALLGPLYAHLGRDPYPAALMKRSAPHVYRWTERMNAPETIEDHIAARIQAGLFADTALPAGLTALLGFIAEDYLPELQAHVAYAAAWLAERPNLPAGSNGLDDPAARNLGMTTFEWRGIEITSVVMPYCFYLLQRVQAAVERLSADERMQLDGIFAQSGLAPLLQLHLPRRVARVNHLEVWQ
jgi:glutathione S-transferase